MGRPYYFPIIYDTRQAACIEAAFDKHLDVCDVAITWGNENDRGATCPVVTLRLNREQAERLHQELKDCGFCGLSENVTL